MDKDKEVVIPTLKSERLRRRKESVARGACMGTPTVHQSPVIGDEDGCLQNPAGWRDPQTAG